MTMTQFGGREFRLLQVEIKAALKAVSDKYAIDFDVSGARGGGSKLNLDLAVTTRKTMTGKTHAQLAFEAAAHFYGLKPEHFGQTFMSNREFYRICGVKTQAPKFPILAERVRDGVCFKFPARTVVAGLPKAVAAA